MTARLHHDDEFVELYNASPEAARLSALNLVLVNGNNSTEYARYDLDAGCSIGFLGPGDYLVVASPSVVVPPGTAVIEFPLASANVQNGAPDGLALFDTLSESLVDALSYEGTIGAALINGAPGTYDLVEGTPTVADDSGLGSESLARFPNGSDTNDAANDWTSLPPTPGASNAGPQGAIVINEIDYDQPGTDFDEFVELFNPSADAVNLNGLVLVLINGSTQNEYLRIDLASGPSLTLDPGGYLVVATPTVVVPPGTDVILFAGSSNNVQNGAPDGIVVFDAVSLSIRDALSYEGSILAATIVGAPGTYNLVEGQPTTAMDDTLLPGALARLPNGADSNDAATDWALTSTVTPGAANAP